MTVARTAFNQLTRLRPYTQTIMLFINGCKANKDIYKKAKISLTANSYMGPIYSFAIDLHTFTHGLTCEFQ